MLFLFEHRERTWAADEIRSRLNIDPDATISSSTIVNRRIELRLGDLFERGLVKQDPLTRSFRFAPTEARHSEFVEQLFTNQEDREQALSLIYLRPRTGAAAFADAFGTTRRPE